MAKPVSLDLLRERTENARVAHASFHAAFIAALDEARGTAPKVKATRGKARGWPKGKKRGPRKAKPEPVAPPKKRRKVADPTTEVTEVAE
jgi:hypothetical protein